MRLIANLAILVSLTSLSAAAALTTRIAEIYPPDEDFENYEVLAYLDGRVFMVSPDNQETLETLSLAKNFDERVELELEDRASFIDSEYPELIKSAFLLADDKRSSNPIDGSSSESFNPGNIEDMDKAREMFERLYKRTSWKAECYNRAHIWNRQLHKDFSLNNEKIFIFYTRKYRRAYRNWKWWFHTAPLVRVNDNPIVLDREYTNGPVTWEAWEWQFSAANRADENHRCRKIDKMSEYYDRYNSNNFFCNILIAPMYYWEPSQIGGRDNGQIKTAWENWELRHAARDVFRYWVDVYNELKLQD